MYQFEIVHNSDSFSCTRTTETVSIEAENLAQAEMILCHKYPKLISFKVL